MKLPQQYDTVLGEDGGSLSQGQKQLLCICEGHAGSSANADPG